VGRPNPLVLAGVVAALAAAGVHAQVPPGATPGGALPRVESAVEPAEPAGELLRGEPFEIPRVYDRPLGLDEGPRLHVEAFRLEGAMDRPERGIRVAEIEALLEAERQAGPQQGFAINQLQEVAGKVAAWYRERGYILAQAFVPEQTVVDGVVVVQVLEGRLAGIRAEGNERYGARVLERPFAGLIGAPIHKDEIESALLTLTNYPGITAFGVLGAGREVGTSELTLRVQAEDRFGVQAVLDNYGSPFAGEYRGQVTFTYNNPLGRADRLQLIGLYALDSADRHNRGAYWGVDYEIPLFSPRDSLRFAHLTNAYVIGANAASVLGTQTEGETRVDEIGYRHDFARTRLGTASLGAAFSIKRAAFAAPLAVIYEDKLATARLDGEWERIDTRFRGVNRVQFAYTHGFKDLAGSLGDYDPASAMASRLGASGKFDKVTLELRRLQRLTRNTSLLLRLEGQYSDDPLVSLEQFSLGGPTSVRAYAASEVLAESGGIVSAELMFPVPGLAGRPAFGGLTWGQLLQLSVFADYAYGELNPPLLPLQDASVELSGAGAAVQLSVPGRVFARLDVATPLGDEPPGNNRDPQVYFRFGAGF